MRRMAPHVARFLEEHRKALGILVGGAAATAVAGYFEDTVRESVGLALHWLELRANSAAAWLRASHPLPGWVILLAPPILILIAPAWGVISRSFWCRAYRSDAIYEVVWRWRWQWRSTRFAISELLPCCPRCNHELIEGHAYSPVRMYLKCENCGYRTDYSHHSYLFELKGSIERHVRRHIRNGSWRESKERVEDLELSAGEETRREHRARG